MGSGKGAHMKIALPFDGSDNALRAVQYAAKFAQDYPPVEIELVHVLDPANFRSLSPEELDQLCPDESKRVTSVARAVLEQAAVPYRIKCRVGNPGKEIAAQVAESECDSVIMGTKGMSPVGPVIMGSVATKVVHLVSVPVTLVK